MPKPGSLVVKLRSKDIERNQERVIPTDAASSTHKNKQKSGAYKPTRNYNLRGGRAQKNRRDRIPSTMSKANGQMNPNRKESRKNQSAPPRNLVLAERMFSKSLRKKMVRFSGKQWLDRRPTPRCYLVQAGVVLKA